MSVILYRIAAAILLFFTCGHTYGFLSFLPPGMEGRAVWDAMNHTAFTVSGHTYTYGGFYTAFGLDLSCYLAFSAFLAWYLGQMVKRAPQAVRPLSVAFALLQIGGAVLSGIYFGPVQVGFGGLVAALIVGATLALPKPAAAQK